MSPVPSSIKISAKQKEETTETMYLYIGLSIFIVLALLCLLSKPIRDQFKFLLLPLLICSGICLGYYIITGKSPTQIPSEINAYFGDPHLQDEPSHKYYQDPEKVYGKQIN